jgi:Big-like domain-containing protein
MLSPSRLEPIFWIAAGDMQMKIEGVPALKTKLMTSRNLSLLLAAVLMCTFGVSCGGGGGGGGTSASNAFLSVITIEGVAGAVGPNDIPSNVAINAAIFFTFLGPVDPGSLPADGAADSGSIRITNNANGTGALGTWTIKSDDPNTVIFTAFPPLDSSDPCGGGLAADSTYTIFIPSGGGGLQNVIRVGGTPLAESELRTFAVSTCEIIDPAPGLPEIVAITPPANPTAPAIDASATETGASGQSQILIDFNEPIDPASISAANIAIINVSAGANPLPVPLNPSNAIVFQQFGTVLGASVARITLNTSSLLTENQTYEIRISGITDLGGNPVTVPPGELLFAINDDPATSFMPQIFSDSFDDDSNLLEEVGAIDWGGTGIVTSTFPLEIVGTGDDGIGVFNSPITINTDNFTQGSVVTTNGVFDFTDLTINAGNSAPFTLSFSSTTDVAPGASNFSVNIRATGTISIGNNTVINCDGRDGEDGGPAGAAGFSSSLGGWGGPGGGAGGVASANVDGNPTPSGAPGAGANVDSMDPTQPGGDQNFNIGGPLSGGGGGGQIGAGPQTQFGPGGGGGGGASLFTGYTGADPANWSFTGNAPGEPHSMSPQAPGAAGTDPAAFVTPFTVFNPAGSGGGGGGDRVVSPTFITTHAPGGGGGGGGGAIRIAAGGSITVGQVAQITCRGGAGGTTSLTVIGRGGGGSGGSVWIQTFSNINLGPGASFFCDGGAGGTNLNPAEDGDGGRGGDGAIQLEDSNSALLFNTLAAGSIVQGEVRVQDFSFTDDVTGTAFSQIIDTGSTTAQYTSASFTLANNMFAFGTATVMVLGIAEDPSNPGQPATMATSPGGFQLMQGPVPVANIADLNGYRYFQVQVMTSFPAPGSAGGAPAIGDPLPAVDSVTVNYQTEM